MILITMHEHDILYFDIIDLSMRALVQHDDAFEKSSIADPVAVAVLGLLDPDPVVRGMGPDQNPSIIKQNNKKNVDS